MVQTISAEKVTLYELEQHFGLVQVEDADFFLEWQTDLRPLTEAEQQRLVRVRTAYENLARRSVLENTVKLVVVAPLLDLAGLFFPPFYVSTEEEVNIEVADTGMAVRGRMDVLVWKDQLWVLVIESKRAELSLKVGVPQALAYMLAAPPTQRSLYGLVTNGSNFVFLKLERQDKPRYGRSREFVLENDGDLGTVLQVMTRLANLIGAA
jgi:predicted type IV restriction endonuclease